MKPILLIDDDDDDKEFFLDVLEEIDSTLKCQTASNGFLALQQLAMSNNLPKLIFLDLNMPVMNGRQFLAEVKKDQQLRNIPVIILSTSSDETTITEMERLGAAEFITKPNKLSLLESHLRKILSNPTYANR